jgi:hypothetical protein
MRKILYFYIKIINKFNLNFMCIDSLDLQNTFKMLEEMEKRSKVRLREYLTKFKKKDGTIIYKRNIYNFEDLYQMLESKDWFLMPSDFS